MRCRRPVFFGWLVVSRGAAWCLFLPSQQTPKQAIATFFAANSGSQGSLAHACAMLPRSHRRGSTYRNRHPKPNPRAPGKGGARGCCGAAGVAWGCFGSDQRRWLTEIKFSLPALRESPAGALASTLQKPNLGLPNRHSKPTSRPPGKRGFVSVVGQLGLLWGALVRTPNARAAAGY